MKIIGTIFILLSLYMGFSAFHALEKTDFDGVMLKETYGSKYWEEKLKLEKVPLDEKASMLSEVLFTNQRGLRCYNYLVTNSSLLGLSSVCLLTTGICFCIKRKEYPNKRLHSIAGSARSE